MMIADVDQGNVVDNLLMVYRDKKDPRAPLHTVKSNNMMIMREAVSTMMSVGRVIEPMTLQVMGASEDVYEEVKKIYLSDRSIDKAVKLITAHSQGLLVESDFIFHSMARRNRIGRKSEGKVEVSHLYSNIAETWVMNVDPIRKEVVYEVYSCSDIIVVNPQMTKLMDEDLRKESASDFAKFYWRNGRKTVHPVAPMSEYTLEPHIESSHSTWNTWLLLTIDPGHSYKGIKEVNILVSKDKYYIYGEMLMKISDTFKDDDFYTKFHEFIGVEMDMVSLQTFVTENDMCVDNPLEPIESKKGMMVSLEEEVKAYSKEFMMQSMLDAFGANDDDDDDMDFGSMVVAMETNQPKDAMGELVMDFNNIAGWSDILEAAQNVVGSERLMDVPKSERLHMTELLTRNVSSVVSKEFKIRFSDIREAFRKEKNPSSIRAKSVWSIIATVINKNEKVRCSWLTRMALVYIYSRISTRHGIPIPTEVNILSSLKTELVTLIQERSAIEDAFDSIISDYYGSE
ncbi:uncharacterized protein [Lepeophtheirus salmonis]|uniref:uncharacterized protein n=1 Tax=Lepeophtheirus salmonis TaxID=72036 RepID=UPI001AE665F3|nr:uncharacterized protein LOC121129668 [Lepeophtheirus salmonis]